MTTGVSCKIDHVLSMKSNVNNESTLMEFADITAGTVSPVRDRCFEDVTGVSSLLQCHPHAEDPVIRNGKSIANDRARANKAVLPQDDCCRKSSSWGPDSTNCPRS